MPHFVCGDAGQGTANGPPTSELGMLDYGLNENRELGKNYIAATHRHAEDIARHSFAARFDG